MRLQNVWKRSEFASDDNKDRQVRQSEGGSMAFEHVSVLLHETVDGLNVKPDGIYVDATLVEADMHMKSVQSLASRGD